MAKSAPNATKRQADGSPPRAVASAHPGAPDHVKRGFEWRKSVVVAIAALAVLAPLVWIVAANVGYPVPGDAVATRFGDWATATAARARSVMPDRTTTLDLAEPEKASRSVVPSPRGGRRVALVVGNAGYRHATRLANPRNDARDMAAALAELGFDVVRGLDLEGEAFYRRIDEFEKRTEGARAALFYYAGHGMQLGDANYLLPVDAKPDSERVLKGTAVKLDDVLAGMKSDIRLVFLDACRDNPFLNSIARARGVRSSAMHRGLKRVDDVQGGMFIAYATAPGDVAADGGSRNSPFTAALKLHIGEPGMEINQVINRVRRTVVAAQPAQRPWHSSSLHDDFFFAPASSSPGGSPPVPRVDPAEEQWEQIKSSTNIAHFERFIRTYSNSPLVPAAQARLEQLRERTLVADFQTHLNAMGFRAGTPDGILGDQTRKAMAAFAQLQRVPAVVSADLLKASKRARDDGFRNFLGCRTERSPRTVHDTERVPSEVSEWAQDSIDVSVRQDDACNPSLVCGYNPWLGPGYPNYGAQCDRQCETMQRGLFSHVEHRVLADLEKECRDDLEYEDVEDFRDVRVDRVSEIDCRCPRGSMCHCYYEANCAFQALETYTEYETKTVAKTVYDEREVCECRAPEVSGREGCVRPTN